MLGILKRLRAHCCTGPGSSSPGFEELINIKFPQCPLLLSSQKIDNFNPAQLEIPSAHLFDLSLGRSLTAVFFKLLVHVIFEIFFRRPHFHHSFSIGIIG